MIPCDEDTTGALQAKNIHGEWIDMVSPPGSLAMNVGDMLSHWSNGFYTSTPHRVLLSSKNPNRARISLPFFYEPNWEAQIIPIPFGANQSEEREFEDEKDLEILRRIKNEEKEKGKRKKVEGIVYGEHLKSKVLSNFY